jgi:hypothetical protein
MTRPRYDGPRAGAAVLRRHVACLTLAHLDDRDAAPYIADAFRAAGGEVREPTFQARGRIWRNVIARFGPAAGP